MTCVFGLIALDVMFHDPRVLAEASSIAKQFHQPVVGSGHRGKILPGFTLDSGFCCCMYCAP